jgi:Mg2+/Co2+ transporter CorB
MDIGLFITIGVIILIAASGFFAGTETALTGFSRARMFAKEAAGDRRAALVNRIRQRKDRMIGALMLGNTAVHILASSLTTSVMINYLGDTGILVATVLMTVMMLVFGEVLPKTYALHYADSMALKVAPLIRLIIILFSPVTEAVTWIVRLFLHLFGVDISKSISGPHHEVLRGAIEMHNGPGEETHAQRAMLRSILDLAEVDVIDIMTHRSKVVMIDSGEPMESIVKTVLDSAHTRLPVWKDNPDNIVGVLHAKHLLRELHDNKGDLDRITLDRLLIEARFVPETTNLFDQLQAFREKKEHFAVVVDEYGAFKGVVTLEDILEEIVGDIDDEHDVNVSGVRKIGPRTYIINGSVTIRDLNREFDWKLSDEEYSTLAGLVIYESQTIPDPGQSFTFHGFRFDIIRRQRNQITKVRVIAPVERRAHSRAGSQG